MSRIRSLTRRLETLGLNEFLDVRSLPKVVADELGIADEKDIRISGKTRAYYTKKHPWLADKHVEVVKSLLFPDQIVMDKSIGNRVLFYRHGVEGMVVLVVVEVKKAPGINHKVVTAFEIGPDEVARRQALERVIWQKPG